MIQEQEKPQTYRLSLGETERRKYPKQRVQVRHYASSCILGYLVATTSTLAADAEHEAEQEPEARFEVNEYRVLGNTVLPDSDIEKAVYGHLGPSMTIKDVEAARSDLEAAYRDHGYGTVFVDVPEQDVDSGIVRLRVVEGKLYRPRVVGTRFFSKRQILEKLPEVQPGKVPHLPTLQAQLTEVNSITGDRVVTPILKAGPEPGTVDLALRVDDHLPFHGSVELNNQYTVDTSTLRALGALSYDNLFRRFDSISLQYQTSPQNTREVDVWVGSYTAKFDDLRWALYYIHSNSHIATLTTQATTSETTSSSQILIVGRGDVYGSRVILPLENSASTTQNVTFGAEYKDFIQNVNANSQVGTEAPTTAVIQTPIRYVNLSIDYGAFWRGTSVQASFDTAANFGVRGLASDETQFENKRFHGKPNYFYMRSSGSLGARLPGDLTALWKISGQYAVEPVVSNEEYSITGADAVRGYLEAEELGDMGFKTTFQFGSPRWSMVNKHFFVDAFVFYDYGKMGVIDALPSEPSGESLRSWGAGLNLSFADHVTGVLTWAYPLVAGTATRAGDSRVLFSIRGSW